MSEIDKTRQPFQMPTDSTTLPVEPPPLILSREDLEKLERQLIPVLNTVRRLLGKPPFMPWS